MKKRRIHLYFLLSVAVILACFATSLHAADYTFSQAWEQLLELSDTLAAQQAAVERHQHLQLAASKRHFPDITLDGQYLHLSDPLVVDARSLEPMASMDPQMIRQALVSLAATGQISPQFARDIGVLFQHLIGQDVDLTTEIVSQNIFASGLRATWPLFTGWRITAAEQIATEQTRAEKARLAMVRQEQFTALAKVYFGVVLAEQIAQTKKEVENGLGIHYQHALALEQQGQIARVERLEAQAAYDRSRVATGKAYRMLEIAQLALRKALHQEEKVQPVSPLFIKDALPDPDAICEQTLRLHPGLALLQAKQDQAKGLIRVEQGRYYPQVYAFANYNLYTEDDIVGEATPDWQAGLGVSLTLFDSKGRGERVAAANAALFQTTCLYRQAERDLSVLVEKTWKQSRQALEEYKGLASSVDLARENVRLRQKGFSQGMATSLDVVDARLFLEGVTTQRLAAAYAYVTALAHLFAMSGQCDQFTAYQQQAQSVLRHQSTTAHQQPFFEIDN
ncbi:MAG: hypothetical protein CSA22_01875 [Deltaproteobacteria bacterium]|nr:MAG: hypothetical protein CSA22_01875 [Deltaproteobacteria bacterium]